MHFHNEEWKLAYMKIAHEICIYENSTWNHFMGISTVFCFTKVLEQRSILFFDYLYFQSFYLFI
jgi:hypothetical protein